MSKKISKIITCKVPVRIDFGGGPTDIQPFPQYEDGFVVNATINLYAKVRLEIYNKTKEIIIQSKDFKIIEKFDNINYLNLSGKTKLIKTIINYINPSFGFKITTEVDVPSGSGLGSSAALTIAILRVLNYVQEEDYFNIQKLIDNAIHIENELLNNICGGQDQYASTLGGFHSLVFHKNKVQLKKLNVYKKIKKEIEMNSLLCFSGLTHVSGTILNQVMNNFVSDDNKTSKALFSIKNNAIKIANLLEGKDINEFDLFLNKIFINQKKLHTSITTPNINKIISLTLKYEGTGGKIMGAGSGGFVFLYCINKKKINHIKTKLENNGFKTFQFKFIDKGPVIKVLK